MFVPCRLVSKGPKNPKNIDRTTDINKIKMEIKKGLTKKVQQGHEITFQ